MATYNPSKLDEPYVTDLKVFVFNEPMGVKDSWELVPRGNSVDLNAGAGGPFIYLAQRKFRGIRTPASPPPITGVVILQGEQATCPPLYHWTYDDGTGPIDLNLGVGGEYIYIAWTYFYAPNMPGIAPIYDISIVEGDSPEEAYEKVWPSYERYDFDLNKGAGGKYIYLTYRTLGFNKGGE